MCAKFCRPGWHSLKSFGSIAELQNLQILYLINEALLGRTTALLLEGLGVGGVEHVRTIEGALVELIHSNDNLRIVDV